MTLGTGMAMGMAMANDRQRVRHKLWII